LCPDQGTASLSGASRRGQRPADVLDLRNSPAGLYYVGREAGGFGLGIHQALDSALNVSQLVLDYHQALGRVGTTGS